MAKEDIKFAYIYERKEGTYQGKKQEYLKQCGVELGVSYFSDRGEKIFIPYSGSEKLLNKAILCVGENLVDCEHVASIVIREVPWDYMKNISIEDCRRKLATSNSKYYKINYVKRKPSRINDIDELAYAKSLFSELIRELRPLSIQDAYQEIAFAIVGQDKPIQEVLSTYYFNQQLFSLGYSNELIAKKKENMLLLGSTGVGKTELARQLSQCFGVPCVIEDATQYTEAGYVGGDIDDILRHLYNKAKGNMELAQRGIVVLDEIDKLAQTEGNSTVKRKGVQQALLSILEGETRYTADGKRAFDTSHLTFIALGAFEGLDEIRKNRISKLRGIGFQSETGSTTTLDDTQYEMEDFVAFGMEKQLMARFRKFITMNTLTKEDYRRILTSSTISTLGINTKVFESLGIHVKLDPTLLDKIADEAVTLNLGVRGLDRIVERMMSKLYFEAFSTPTVEFVQEEQVAKTGREYIFKA